MSDLIFIKDVIYGLKMEYGSSATFAKNALTINLDTGVKSGTTTTKYVDRVIPLPLDRRNAFLKSVGVHKETLVNLNDQQFLIDRDDLGTFVVAEEDTINGMKIKQIEFFEYALILTTTKAG